MKAKGQPAKTGRGPAKRARFAHGVHVGQPLSAYVSTNSGEEERRDEIMGPTASRTRSGRLLCPGISDFGGHRVLGAGAQDPGDRKPLWPPPSPIIRHIYPNFLCTGSSFSLLCPQSRKLDLPYCPAFQNSSRNNRTLLSILKSNLPLCFPPSLQLLLLGTEKPGNPLPPRQAHYTPPQEHWALGLPTSPRRALKLWRLPQRSI